MRSRSAHDAQGDLINGWQLCDMVQSPGKGGRLPKLGEGHCYSQGSPAGMESACHTSATAVLTRECSQDGAQQRVWGHSGTHHTSTSCHLAWTSASPLPGERCHLHFADGCPGPRLSPGTRTLAAMLSGMPIGIPACPRPELFHSYLCPQAWPGVPWGSICG